MYRFVALSLLMLSIGTSYGQTPTSEVPQKKAVTFFSQSSAGHIVNCGLDFDGMDDELNYFSGSLSVVWSAEKTLLVGIFKLTAATVDITTLNLNREYVQKGWARSSKTISTIDWLETRGEDNVFLSVTGNPEEGLTILKDILSAQRLIIGYQLKGGFFDRVYDLGTLSEDEIFKGIICLRELMETVESQTR